MLAVTHDGAYLRIGELSRRVGVSTHVLRAWESRYGLLHPTRTSGGFRLYSEADERRVRRMQTYLVAGLSAAQAAERARSEQDLEQVSTPPRSARGEEPQEDATGTVADHARRLRDALDDFDERAAHAVLDRLLDQFTVELVLREVVVPYLGDLGARWDRGEVSVAQEHFASHVIRGRLSALARGWGVGRGPTAVLASPPGELHDHALMAFGIVLHRAGWRVRFLGASTPIEDLARVVEGSPPDLVVLAAVSPERFSSIVVELERLTTMTAVAVAGARASPDLARATGARLLLEDPVTAAELIGAE